MKKICLSIDQMRQLKELGVDTKDASMCWVRDPEGKYTPSIHDEYCYEMSFMNPVPAFTLQDMIEMMPKKIPDKKGGSPYELDLIISKTGFVYSIRRHIADCLLGTHIHDNPLDAAFDMLVWLAKHGYLKGGEK